MLQEAGIAHRDIKPDNLFWFGNRAVFGDFGIATWPNRDANLTAFGEKVGSAHFLAPEVRAIGDSVDYFAADVWSLIKAMHVLANPADGPYPPGGTHYHGVAEFSLQASGDQAAAELEWLLETCTNSDPVRRLAAKDLADELRVWLRQASSRNDPAVLPAQRLPDLGQVCRASGVAKVSADHSNRRPTDHGSSHRGR